MDLFQPALARLGLAPVEGERDMDAKLRGTLVGAQGSLGADPEILEAAREMVRSMIAGDDVDPELGTAALRVVARHADQSDFDKLWAAYEESALSAEKVRFLRAIGSANVDTAGEFVIERILDGGIRTQDGLMMVALVLMAEPGDRAWQALRSRWDDVLGAMPPFTHRMIVAGIPALSRPETAADVKGFFAESEFGKDSIFAVQRLELLDANVAFRARATSEVSKYFEGAQ